MQPPTLTGMRIRSTYDARVVFHAVNVALLPMVTRRLDTDERRAVCSGCVFVWEERGPNSEATGLGIERWTDGIRWGPSRVRDEFLFYHEKDPEPDTDMTETETASQSSSSSPRSGYQPESRRNRLADRLIKQTYSAMVETPRGRRKWHLTAYFTQESLDYLHAIDDIPALRNLQVPEGMYRSARSGKGRAREDGMPTDQRIPSMHEYDYPPAPYPTYGSPPPLPHLFAHEPPVRGTLQPSVWPEHSPPPPPPPVGPHTYPHPHPHSQSHPHPHPHLYSHSQPHPYTYPPSHNPTLADPSHPRQATGFRQPPSTLAPLAYLENMQNRVMPRHPLDDQALRSFVPV